jgi:general stress protein 26
MVDLDRTLSDPIGQLFKELGRAHAGMLGLVGSPEALQPMHHQIDEEGRRLYFFTKSNTDLVRSTGDGAEAHFVLVGKDHDYHASLTGRLTTTRSREVIDRFWNAVAAAWFAGGKEDPELIVLEFTPESGVVWGSTGSTLRFGWEIAKANMTEAEPDVGVRREVRF